MKKAFTLIELLVAVGILAVMVSFSSVILKAGIESNRVAAANAEIMRNLRAITDQLNSDFKGIRNEPTGLPLKIGYEQSRINGILVPDVNSDRIALFANGDFQTTQQYDGKTVVGNVAAIFYGLIDPNSYGTIPEPRYKILARRQTILTSNDSLSATPYMLGEYEFTSFSKILADMRADPNTLNDTLTERPLMTLPNLTDQDLAVYMARGVDDFTIEYSEGGVLWLRPADTSSISPIAFKFSFTLYDSKGIIRNGRRFTHIVYLGN